MLVRSVDRDGGNQWTVFPDHDACRSPFPAAAYGKPIFEPDFSNIIHYQVIASVGTVHGLQINDQLATVTSRINGCKKESDGAVFAFEGGGEVARSSQNNCSDQFYHPLLK